MPEIVNLTPHPVTLVGPEGHKVTIPPSGTVARVEERKTFVGTVRVPTGGGHLMPIPLYEVSYGEITGLPADPEDPKDPKWEGIFIVSALVAHAIRAKYPDIAVIRSKFVYPTDFERDPNGNIVAAKALASV